MKILRITFFLSVLLLAQVSLGALIVVAIGVESSSSWVLEKYVASYILATCVFVWMSWTTPGKPFAAAFVVGIGAELLDAIATAIIVGKITWDPVVFVFSFSTLCIAVLVGVNVGEKLRKSSTR